MVFYLKVNREKEYTLTNLRHWIDVASINKENLIYILCDNEKLKNEIIATFDLNGNTIRFLKSEYNDKDIEEIVNSTTLGAWKKIAYAHLSTFLHARENNFSEFWNIDADDTFLCMDPLRLSEVLSQVEEYCKEHGIHLSNLDMWHSVSRYEEWSDVLHWSFGMTYTDNSVDWITILKKHMRDEKYHRMKKLHSNIDWYFTYLSKNTELNIKSFYFENLKFIHYYGNFIDYPHKGTVYHYKDGKLTFPILKYCFGLEEMGEIEIADDSIKFEIGLSDSEATVSLIGSCMEKEVFARELKKIKDIDDMAPRRAENYKLKNGYKSIVFYGAGDYLNRNYEILKKVGVIEYISDSNPSKWGKEIFEGIVCISPEEIKRLEDYIVIIAVEQVTMAFEIAGYLRKKGITEVDHIDNLKRYLLGIY